VEVELARSAALSGDYAASLAAYERAIRAIQARLSADPSRQWAAARAELAKECSLVRETERVLERMHSNVPGVLHTDWAGGSEAVPLPQPQPQPQLPAQLSPRRAAAAAAAAAEATQEEADASARAAAAAAERRAAEQRAALERRAAVRGAQCRAVRPPARCAMRAVTRGCSHPSVPMGHSNQVTVLRSQWSALCCVRRGRCIVCVSRGRRSGRRRRTCARRRRGVARRRRS
jgi:hypothetical protein